MWVRVPVWQNEKETFVSHDNKDSKLLRRQHGVNPVLDTMSSTIIRRKEIEDIGIDAEVYIWIEIYNYKN